MKIENQPREDQQTNLIVELEQIEFDKYIQQAARKISREAKIAGFRPGKAPFDVVKRVYGMEMIEKQAIELAVDEVYPKAIEEWNYPTKNGWSFRIKDKKRTRIGQGLC